MAWLDQVIFASPLSFLSFLSFPSPFLHCLSTLPLSSITFPSPPPSLLLLLLSTHPLATPYPSHKIDLSAHGFFSRPDVGYNESGKILFSYHVSGAVCAEVEVDCLTGDYQVPPFSFPLLSFLFLLHHLLLLPRPSSFLTLSFLCSSTIVSVPSSHRLTSDYPHRHRDGRRRFPFSLHRHWSNRGRLRAGSRMEYDRGGRLQQTRRRRHTVSVLLFFIRCF